MLTSCRATARSPLWLAVSTGVAIALPLITSTSAFAGYVGSGGCIGRWTMFSCVTIDGGAVDPYVRYVPEPFSDADRARQAERDREWVARCRPIIVQDGYGVPRYHYAAPGCEFGVSKD